MEKRQSYQGQNAYENFMSGGRNTRKEAMLAKCYECMGLYGEGKEDCLGKSCPLYQYYPYRKQVLEHT